MAAIINFNGTSAPTTGNLSDGTAATQAGGAIQDVNGNIASYNRNDPQAAMYGGFRVGNPNTTTTDPGFLKTSLGLNFWDPNGPASRTLGDGLQGRTYTGPWVDPYDTTRYSGVHYRNEGGDQVFKWNQAMMTVAQNFDPFMQKKEMTFPHWWLNRIPRSAYPLHDGVVHETRIYRGGLSIYGGLGMWKDLAGDPTSVDACAPLDYRTYTYAWETLAWSGKRTAWGSDPICIETMKFIPKAVEQIGWILETGVKFGTDIQNIWNRDMFIYQTVMAGRSYLMTSEYRGAASPRYVYQPFCLLGSAANPAGGDLNAPEAKKPFIVFDASVDLEPINFDVLDTVRNDLKRRCPEAAVGHIGTEPMFALAISSEDVEKYVRGNEEERRYWIEANPNALIQHYGFAPNTFRRWTITEDGDQLRFKIKTSFAKGTTIASSLKKYGLVGAAEFATGATDADTLTVPVYIAEMVDPVVAGRSGINGAPVPVPNPDYDTAEIAIAPVFMNRVFTNQFVPDEKSLGAGTWFGPKTGLNGKWAWQNIQTKENPFNKIGNFYGEYQIVPKPDTCVFDCISFLYRRCTVPLRSLCPHENIRINGGVEVPGAGGVAISGVKAANYGVLVKVDGNTVKIYPDGESDSDSEASDPDYAAVIVTLAAPAQLAAGDKVKIGDICGVVSEAISTTRFEIALSGTGFSKAVNTVTLGTTKLTMQ